MQLVTASRNITKAFLFDAVGFLPYLFLANFHPPVSSSISYNSYQRGRAKAVTCFLWDVKPASCCPCCITGWCNIHGGASFFYMHEPKDAHDCLLLLWLIGERQDGMQVGIQTHDKVNATQEPNYILFCMGASSDVHSHADSWERCERSWGGPGNDLPGGIQTFHSGSSKY